MALAWHLSSRPQGRPGPEHFDLRELGARPLAEDEVRVRNGWLSLDPAMRIRMNADTDGYQPSFPIGEPLTGGGVGEVIESRSAKFAPGDKVQHMVGWRDESVGPDTAFTKLPDYPVPDQYYLHHMGVIGFTAYVGLVKEAQPKAGETLFVSAAGGATGSAVVQIGKILGMRVVGSAGGVEKCAMVRELGADAVIDYKAPGTMIDKLAAAAPEGVDVYFDNVGGDHLDAALALANMHARFSISGMVGAYNGMAQGMELHHLMRVVYRRISIKGFIGRDNIANYADFRRQMSEWIASGQVKSRETVRDGLEAMPAAFAEMFDGRVSGKMLVRL